jgi:hypothetical protein
MDEAANHFERSETRDSGQGNVANQEKRKGKYIKLLWIWFSQLNSTGHHDLVIIRGRFYSFIVSSPVNLRRNLGVKTQCYQHRFNKVEFAWPSCNFTQ